MNYKDYRIPIINREQFAGSHQHIPIDQHDPKFQEPMVNLADYGIAFESYHAKTDGNNPPYYHAIDGSHHEGWLRRSVTERIVRANALLLPFNVEILVLDAYRSMDCQRGLWHFFYQRGQQLQPEGNDHDWTQYALGYVRDPRHFDRLNASTFPAHATGAAIDATLIKKEDGQQLDMGSRFEEIIDVSYTDYFERCLNKKLISADDHRLQNRRLMHWALSSAGFLNDPILFWHYDWGNQPYVKLQKALFNNPPQAAWYGYIDSPQWRQPSHSVTTKTNNSTIIS